MFPNDDHVRNEISSALSEEFEVSRKLLRYWMTSGVKLYILDESNLPKESIVVAFAMHVRMCRLMRGVLQLCEIGEGNGSAALARSMFDTLLVTEFVLKPRFAPKKLNKDGSKTKAFASPNRLTREFRAELYLSYCLSQPSNLLERLPNLPGKKTIGRMLQKLSDPKALGVYQTKIGSFWVNQHKKFPFTYSGLNTKNLSASLHGSYLKWYGTVYPMQSESIHAADPLEYISIEAPNRVTARWHSSVGQIRSSIQSARLLLLANAMSMQKYIDFGWSSHTVLQGIARHHEKLLHTKQDSSSNS